MQAGRQVYASQTPLSFPVSRGQLFHIRSDMSLSVCFCFRWIPCVMLSIRRADTVMVLEGIHCTVHTV